MDGSVQYVKVSGGFGLDASLKDVVRGAVFKVESIVGGMLKLSSSEEICKVKTGIFRTEYNDGVWAMVRDKKECLEPVVTMVQSPQWMQ